MVTRTATFASPLHADPRGLAALRVSLGLILAAETLWLLPRAEALLSNAGVLPLQCLERSLAPCTQFWSIHRGSGGVLVQQLLLLAQLAAAGCLVAGYRSRLAALCGWALFSSVINRNPLMAHGGDTLLRMELLLASFAPIASRWSVDAHAHATPPAAANAPVRSLGVGGLLLQPVLMYVFAGALKFFPEWRDPAHYSAVHYALHRAALHRHTHAHTHPAPIPHPSRTLILTHPAPSPPEARLPLRRSRHVHAYVHGMCILCMCAKPDPDPDPNPNPDH